MSVVNTVEEIVIDNSAAAEPIAAVVVEAGAGNIKRIIVEKVTKNSTVRTGLMIAGGVVVVGAAGYAGFKALKAYKQKKDAKAKKA